MIFRGEFSLHGGLSAVFRPRSFGFARFKSTGFSVKRVVSVNQSETLLKQASGRDHADDATAHACSTWQYHGRTFKPIVGAVL